MSDKDLLHHEAQVWSDSSRNVDEYPVTFIFPCVPERIFGDHLSIEGGQGDDRTIARAARLFVREGEAMLTEALEAGLPASSAAETEPAVIFAARWANLFAGQLAEWPED